MNIPPKIIAGSLAELAEHVQAARAIANGRTILVPVDFSDHSAAALYHAAEFAEMLPAALVVLHVIHEPGEMPGYYSSLIQEHHSPRIQDAAEEAFRGFMERAMASRPDSMPLQEATILMVFGLPVTRILEIVGELEPVMVVVGSQGRTGLDHMIIGSKAGQIAQLCPVPVTIVKKKDEPGED